MVPVHNKLLWMLPVYTTYWYNAINGLKSRCYKYFKYLVWKSSSFNRYIINGKKTLIYTGIYFSFFLMSLFSIFNFSLLSPLSSSEFSLFLFNKITLKEIKWNRYNIRILPLRQGSLPLSPSLPPSVSLTLFLFLTWWWETYELQMWKVIKSCIQLPAQYS